MYFLPYCYEGTVHLYTVLYCMKGTKVICIVYTWPKYTAPPLHYDFSGPGGAICCKQNRVVGLFPDIIAHVFGAKIMRLLTLA